MLGRQPLHEKLKGLSGPKRQRFREKSPAECGRAFQLGMLAIDFARVAIIWVNDVKVRSQRLQPFPPLFDRPRVPGIWQSGQKPLDQWIKSLWKFIFGGGRCCPEVIPIR